MIIKATKKDVEIVANLALLLWPNHHLKELEQEFLELLESKKSAIFLKYINENAVGFAYVNLRNDYVEGSSSSPVGYLEGIFVKEEFRKRGFAKELLESCEKWAKEQGVKEFASDCEITNQKSLSFHKALGFKEANRIICFVKKI
ncbi:GNAT family N-acetyltransferase [Helicobacter valdiviensis]|uniref:Aminoglycoside N(6')-acetyltransferase type 1 n=1 Tax=Helicobacter valdiviensis TaxID=1458358 RepID=A0A2W6MUW1_9HELI|nr:aminoglycoside 6'-N-acetyltransferase [Helicobacter valdiviensis]PZT48142.1 GNAT family N-acetyltransferase [Helicobacter valdiviensis]